MIKKITRVSVLKKYFFDDMVKQHQSNILISWYEILIMPINENPFPARPTNNTLIAALLKNDTDEDTYTLMIAGGEAPTEYMIMNSPVMHQSAIDQMRKSAYKWHLSDCNVKAKPIKKSKEKCEKSAGPAPECHATDREKMVMLMLSNYLNKFQICFDLKCAQEYRDNAALANGIRKYSDIIYRANQATGMVIHMFGQAYVLYDTNNRRIRLGFTIDCSVDNIIHIMKMVVNNHAANGGE